MKPQDEVRALGPTESWGPLFLSVRVFAQSAGNGECQLGLLVLLDRFVKCVYLGLHKGSCDRPNKHHRTGNDRVACPRKEVTLGLSDSTVTADFKYSMSGKVISITYLGTRSSTKRSGEYCGGLSIVPETFRWPPPLDWTFRCSRFHQ